MKTGLTAALVIGYCNLLIGQVSISPATDPFMQPGSAEVPCVVGGSSLDGVKGFIQYNTTFSPLIAVNPKNHNMVVAVMNHDRLQVSSNLGSAFTTVPRTQEIAVATSSNGGNTWTTGINTPHHLCLHPNALSNGQSVHALQYAATGTEAGTVFMAGRYSDVQNSTAAHSNSGIWVSSSSNGGKSWSPATILSVQASDVYQTFVGTSDGTPDLALDPSQVSNVYVAWDRPQYSAVSGFQNTIPTAGNVFFSRSNNFGKTWTDPEQIYKITKDIPAGGHCSGVSVVASVKKQRTKALLCSFMRYYKKPGVPDFDKTVDSVFTDRVVIRSTNKGASWDHYARIVSPFIYAQSHDPTKPNPEKPLFPAPDGSEKSHMAINPETGRTYLMWQAGSLSVTDPRQAQYHPEIVVSVSEDNGKIWSEMATVSRTPKELLDKNPGAYQAFNGNIVFLPDNIVGFIYYDYRNYQAGSSRALCDAWLALYKETKSITGGSTKVGLNFLAEVRVTNPSFDATIATSNSANGLVSGLGDVLGVAASDTCILTAFTLPLQNDPANIQTQMIGNFEANVDTNKRLDVQFEKLLVASKEK
jgi:hypothetical protein